MSRLIAFGDSFTWGSDLSDMMTFEDWSKQSHTWMKLNPFHRLYSRKTWPALLADHYEFEYKCYARPGCSNQTMVRTFFEHANEINLCDIVVVNFTWRDRYDFYDSLTNKWETVRPTGTEDNRFHELYYKQIHHSIWDQVESLKAINLILSYLKETNRTFIATCMDPLIYSDPWHTNKLIQTLQTQSEHDITWFEGHGFYEWSKKHNFPVSPSWHPLDEAHEAACRYIKDNAKSIRYLGR